MSARALMNVNIDVPLIRTMSRYLGWIHYMLSRITIEDVTKIRVSVKECTQEAHCAHFIPIFLNMYKEEHGNTI